MSMTDREAVRYLQELRVLAAALPDAELRLFVIPSFTVLSRARRILAGSRIRLGAQNMCWEERGAFTGEISPLSLRELGAELVELGHSERRHIFHETDDEVRGKVCRACDTGLAPLLCIGECAREKALGVTDEVLALQLKIAVGALSRSQAERLLVAYEPVWAIGADGTPAEPDYVAARHARLRRVLTELFGAETGADIPLLFGGSVNPENAAAYLRCPEVNGLFVGRSAWTAEGYAALVRQLLPVFRSKKEGSA